MYGRNDFVSVYGVGGGVGDKDLGGGREESLSSKAKRARLSFSYAVFLPAMFTNSLIELVWVGGTISTNAATDHATLASTSCRVIRRKGIRSALAWLKERMSWTINIGGGRVVADRPVAFVWTELSGVPEFDIAAHMHSFFVAGAGDGDGVAIDVADIGVNRLVVAQFNFGGGAIELRCYANET